MINRSTSTWFVSAVLLLVAAAGFVWANAASDEHAARPAMGPPDIYQAAAAAKNLTTLTKALDAAGLTLTIKGPGPFTVLAPTDEAFRKLPPGTLDSLLRPENRKQLAEILTYHVLPGKVMSDKIRRLRMADSIQGTTLLFRTVNGKVYVDGAEVVAVDIPASNGVIHVIDRVILPKNLVDVAEVSGQFRTLLTAAKAAGLLDVLKAPDERLALFAPTDEAFAMLPPGTVEELLKPESKNRLANILKYHIVPGRNLLKAGKITPMAGPPLEVVEEEGVFTVNGANVLLENIKATNGMVHVIDRVLIPPTDAPAADANKQAMLLIEKAIERGVPAFNMGDPGTCAAIYEAAARSLLAAHADVLDECSRTRLNQAFDQARDETNVRTRAWMLRQALEDVHRWLEEPQPK